MKRIVDLVASFSGLVLLSPLLLAIAAVARCKLGSPVLFTQRRPGLAGRPFWLYKFRTMSDAPDEKGELLPDEQRLLAFGRLLRKTSLDELPTLWNVLKAK